MMIAQVFRNTIDTLSGFIALTTIGAGLAMLPGATGWVFGNFHVPA